MFFETLMKQARDRDPEAQFQIASALISSPDPDSDAILKWMTASANQGHVKAITNLAIIYYFGDLGEQSFEKSFLLFKKASSIGDPAADYYLGISLQKGHGTVVDTASGFQYLMKAANDGMPDAQLSLGKAYEDGTVGIGKDLFAAVSWYAYAAEAGIPGAGDRFNELYYSQHFTDHAGNQRFFWFEERAIESGNMPKDESNERAD